MGEVQSYGQIITVSELDARHARIAAANAKYDQDQQKVLKDAFKADVQAQESAIDQAKQSCQASLGPEKDIPVDVSNKDVSMAQSNVNIATDHVQNTADSYNFSAEANSTLRRLQTRIGALLSFVAGRAGAGFTGSSIVAAASIPGEGFAHAAGEVGLSGTTHYAEAYRLATEEAGYIPAGITRLPGIAETALQAKSFVTGGEALFANVGLETDAMEIAKTARELENYKNSLFENVGGANSPEELKSKFKRYLEARKKLEDRERELEAAKEHHADRVFWAKARVMDNCVADTTQKILPLEKRWEHSDQALKYWPYRKGGG